MPRMLAEFLQEQQEPFVLDLYLLEKGYSTSTISFDATSSFRKSARFFKRSANRGLRKRRHTIPNCSVFVKAIFSKLQVLHNSRKIKNLENVGRKNSREKIERHADEDEFSSVSDTTVFNSCSESSHCSEADVGLRSEKANEDRKLKWRLLEDGNNEDSPVSVLDEIESYEGSPVYDKQYNLKKTQGESSTSKSQWKLRHVGSNSYAQYIINKRALKQTKQLLIDCVRETLENHRKTDEKRQLLKKILGAEELWKFVCENVWLWSQESINISNIFHLLHCDFLASIEEWSNDLEKEKEEISMEIGDAILEGIIKEIVTT